MSVSTILFTSYSFGAEVENYRSITKLAAEASQRGYFRVEEQLNVSCKYNVIYFDLNTDVGKAQLSLLMTAKIAGKEITTLAYNVAADTTCTLSTVEIE